MALTAEATGSKSFKSRRWADVSEVDSPLLFWASRPHGSPCPVLGDRGKRNGGKDGTGKMEEDEEKEEEETASDLSTPKLK